MIFKPSELVVLALGWVGTGASAPGSWMHAWFTTLQPQLGKLQPLELSNALWAMARLDFKPDTAMLGSVQHEMMQQQVQQQQQGPQQQQQRVEQQQQQQGPLLEGLEAAQQQQISLGQQQHHEMETEQQQHRQWRMQWQELLIDEPQQQQQQQSVQADSPVLAMWSLARMDVLPTWSDDLAFYQGWLHDLQKVLANGALPAAAAGASSRHSTPVTSPAAGLSQPVSSCAGDIMREAQQHQQQQQYDNQHHGSQDECQLQLQALQHQADCASELQLQQQWQQQRAGRALVDQEAASLPGQVTPGEPSGLVSHACLEVPHNSMSLSSSSHSGSSSSSSECTSIDGSSSSSDGALCATAAHISFSAGVRATRMATKHSGAHSSNGDKAAQDKDSTEALLASSVKIDGGGRHHHHQQQQEKLAIQPRPTPLTSEQCTMVIAALGRLGSPSWVLPQFPLYWLQQSQQQLSAARPGELACWLWGLGRLRYRPPDAWMQGYLGKVRGVMQELTSQEVVMLLWGLSRLQVRLLAT